MKKQSYDPEERLREYSAPDRRPRPREECGIFAVYGPEEAAKLTYFGLYALQHRGQESAGIVSSDGKRVLEHKGMGLVPEIFDEQILEKLAGHMALGHVRYSTTGSSLLAREFPRGVDFLMPFPDSGNYAALGSRDPDVDMYGGPGP